MRRDWEKRLRRLEPKIERRIYAELVDNEGNVIAGDSPPPGSKARLIMIDVSKADGEALRWERDDEARRCAPSAARGRVRYTLDVGSMTCTAEEV